MIADRQVNAIGAIKESALLLRKTWGEQIAGGGLGLVFGLASILVVILTGVLAALTIDVAALLWTIIAAGVVTLVVLAV